MISVQTNIGSLYAQGSLNANQDMMNKSIQRLSSGFRINSAADDAAGYAISSKLSAQNSRLQAASQNASQASAMVQMADASVNQIQNMVTQIQSLATQAASAQNSAEISKLEAQRAKLETQIDKIANSTNYNGTNLLNGLDSTSAAVTGTAATMGAVSSGSAGTTTVAVTGTATFGENTNFNITLDATGKISSITAGSALVNATTGATVLAASANAVTGAAAATVTFGGLTFTATAGGTPSAGTLTSATTGGTSYVAAGQSAYTGALAFQVGASNSTNDQVSIDLQNKYTTAGLGLSGGTASVFTSQASAQSYITTANSALDTLVSQRAGLGASVNQLGYVNASLSTSMQQVSAAVSTIKDANMASEMANFTKSQVLVQTGTAMLAQANRASQNILSLFR